MYIKHGTTNTNPVFIYPFLVQAPLFPIFYRQRAVVKAKLRSYISPGGYVIMG